MLLGWMIFREELPRQLRESSGARSKPAVFWTFACRPRQATGERWGEGEPELDRCAASSHPQELYRDGASPSRGAVDYLRAGGRARDFLAGDVALLYAVLLLIGSCERAPS